MKRTWIKNARIVNEGETFRGSVVIEGEIIAEILRDNENPAQTCEEVIDANQHYLLPGVIDDHVHFREPGLTHKADIWSETHAAAAGGVTSYMDMPNVSPQTTTLEALENKFDIAAQKSLVNYSFYFGATNSNTVLLPQLDKHRICGIKLFMGSSTGNMLVDRLPVLQQIFRKSEIMIAVHCEDQRIISHNISLYKEKYGEDPPIEFHPQIRDEKACYESSALAVQLAKEAGARLHILHLTTARELKLLEDKPVTEKKITAEACVAHLLYSDKDYARLGSRIKCNPAIKNEENRKALRRALTSNLIDVIGTDHAPHLLSEKQGGSLKAVSGMPMIQFSLIAMMELVKEGILTMEELVRKMCHTPAELFQIRRRGFIRKGYQADLVIVNPDKEWELTPDAILSKCQWSPLEGHRFTAEVERTFVNGQSVYANGRINESVRGQELRFR